MDFILSPKNIDLVVDIKDIALFLAFDDGMQPFLVECNLKVKISLVKSVGDVALLQTINHIDYALGKRLINYFVEHIVSHLVQYDLFPG
jgi:hypothetical protein